jgi:serine/threonine protein kinase
MAFQLEIVAGPEKGRIIQLADVDTLLLGRGRRCHSPLRDPHISRAHCQIRSDGHGVMVTDAMSSSGTLVNGRRITRHQLLPGDRLQIGETVMRLKVEGSSEAGEAGRADNQDDSVMTRPNPFDSIPPWAIRIQDPDPESVAKLLDLAGSKIASFELGQPLDQGKTGILFFARELPRDRIVALKVLWPGFARKTNQLQRFVRAMKTSQVLKHPNLVRIYGAGKSGPCCWIAMEYIEGRSAARFIHDAGVAGRLDWRLALRVAHHIAQALEFAHEHSVIHRNVTPNNVLLRTKDRVAKLGDLMLAKALAGDHAETISSPDQVLGELPYLSPEQTHGTRDLDARSDLYSLGATVYAMVSGRPPFIGITLAEVTERIRKQRVRPLREVQSGPVSNRALTGFQREHIALQLEEVPTAFERIVLRLLAKHPEKRYQSAKQLVSDLERVAGKVGVAL